MQTILTQFTPVFLARSDGKSEVIAKGSKQKNAPSKEQLDRTPNAKGVADYYRELDETEPKNLDWRKKLGGMLVREVGGPQLADKAFTAILHEFPENYRLYEHIKSKVEGDKNPSKNHSGGGHDRQDAYLYGHPRGPKKRFRSPADFFPHLLWLATDESGDPGNCTCKLCCPEQIEVEKPLAKEEEEEANVGTSARNAAGASATHAGTVQVGSNPIVQIPIRKPSTSTTPTASPVPKPAAYPLANTTNAPRLPASLTPTPLPQPRSIDQQIDGQYNKFLGRGGEIVWFRRGPAWGLGAIVRRWLTRDQPNARSYMIQPLSYPLDHQPTAVMTSDRDIRPYLAWSAPPCTSHLLRDRSCTYERVDWHGMVSGRYNSPDNPMNPEVDASILASKSIDGTYTPIEFVKSSGPEDRHFNGIFLGAEKIWVGEPARLRVASNDVMVMTDIIERTLPSTQPDATSQNPRSTVIIVGDVYTLSTVPVANPAAPPQLPSDRALPLRMREDLRWCNSITLPLNRTLSYWRLISTQSRVELGQLRGRWYESSLLFLEGFEQDIKNGKPGESTGMNARGDTSLIGASLGTRKGSRLEAFGPAVPQGTVIMDGIEPPQLPISQPQPQPQVQEQQQPPVHEQHTLELGAMHDINIGTGGGHHDDFADLGAFMNLDDLGNDGWDANFIS
ncbi:hypothetical protein GQ43DRAFT_409629 [Delitschia confertaspora ATCC 74209]|uniref:Cryptic loci regulator 2 N-terminal domain-containing protein n=1 Tax=Delitschia confertaspora ATCC 74209 TaxID=1513339 RepID=A0A9P4JS92_9PLEO|nr:hypothetical protein GQ43DRAFT_409629 [Delitschia confertaspora ATCC 74209]